MTTTNTKKKYIIIFTIAIALLVITYCNYVVIASDISSNSTKYYKSIQINTGDTLWSIALEYCESTDMSVTDYIDELMVLNDIHDDKLIEGNYLVISYIE